MFKVKFLFKLLIYSSLGIFVSLYIGGCGASVPKDTQLYEVNGAKVCDHLQATPDRSDDCDNPKANAGIYFNPGSNSTFYRSPSGENIVVDRDVSAPGTRVGSTMPLRSPVITNASGTPLMNGDALVRSPSRTNPSINTAPIRSTASFDAPGLGKVAAGKTVTANRGLSFGRTTSSSRFGG
ncbi:hypothetical protein [Leptolyngbya sp. AN10]|uniref:hypothetical protein n=1 Tax=Leptolyngbya sp. AN10 TaxID=3423365 RepID=UPI003D32421B